jgi:hypothetical protein
MSDAIKLEVQVIGAAEGARELGQTTAAVNQAAAATAGLRAARESLAREARSQAGAEAALRATINQATTQLKVAAPAQATSKAESYFSGKVYYKEMDTAASGAAQGGLSRVATALQRYGLVASDAGEKSMTIVRVLSRFAGMGEISERIGAIADKWKAVGGALVTATGALAAFSIGWKVGTWIRDVTGLGNALDNAIGANAVLDSYTRQNRMSQRREAFLTGYQARESTVSIGGVELGGSRDAAVAAWDGERARTAALLDYPSLIAMNRDLTPRERAFKDIQGKRLNLTGTDAQRALQLRRREELYTATGGSQGSLDDWVEQGGRDKMDEMASLLVDRSNATIEAERSLADKLAEMNAADEFARERLSLDRELREATKAAEIGKDDALKDRIAQYRNAVLADLDVSRRAADQADERRTILGELTDASSRIPGQIAASEESEEFWTGEQARQRGRALSSNGSLLAERRATRRSQRRQDREDAKLNRLADRAEDQLAGGAAIDELSQREQAALEWRKAGKIADEEKQEQARLQRKQEAMADDIAKIRVALDSLGKGVGVAK